MGNLETRIAELERKLAEAREVIRPFYYAAESLHDDIQDSEHFVTADPKARMLSVGELRRAAQWMKDNQPEK